jgi:hypothetical protein
MKQRQCGQVTNIEIRQSFNNAFKASMSIGLFSA